MFLNLPHLNDALLVALTLAVELALVVRRQHLNDFFTVAEEAWNLFDGSHAQILGADELGCGGIDDGLLVCESGLGLLT